MIWKKTMCAETPSREELMQLSKAQLVNYILNEKTPINVGGPQLNVMEPPSMKDLKLPPKCPGMVITPADYRPITTAVPTPPPIPQDPSQKPKDINKLKPADLEGIKKIFVKCERCDKTFIIDLPRKLVLANPLEVVPVTILHHEEHALTVYLDQNFESRRDYISEIYVLEKNG